MRPASVTGLVTGTVEAGPIRPVEIVGQPSTRPVASAVVEALDDGNVVAATTTDDAGRFELRVPPGTYLIRAAAEGLHSKGPGRTITIFAGETMDLRFVLDTRIRCRWGHQPAMCPLGAQCRWAMRVE